MYRETISLKALLWATPAAAAFAAAANLVFFWTARFVFAIVPVVPAPGPGPEMALAPLTAWPVVVASIVPGLVAGVLLALLGKFWPWRPLTTFRILALVAVLFSLQSPLSLPVIASMKAVLVLMHLIAFGAITGVLTGPWTSVKSPPLVEAFSPKF